MDLISIIIPTYRRDTRVVSNTLRSIFSDSDAVKLISEVILIDQNVPPLDLAPDLSAFQNQIIHITGLSPSVTKAKNFGEKSARGSIYAFFDDDVTVQPGTIVNYASIFEAHPEITYLGGREILDQKVKKESNLRSRLRKFLQSTDPSEKPYQVNGMYVGRVKPNSFMIHQFDTVTHTLVKIDGGRGCNWACRASAFKRVGGFDESYQGTAMREETDLYLRLNLIESGGFYTAQSSVLHHRQPGGCDNLSDSLRSLNSKFENELYFQRKNFPKVGSIFFAIRTLPMALDALRESSGMSLWVWFKYWLKLAFSTN